MQLQSDFRAAGFAAPCSQCPAVLGPQYPHPCITCNKGSAWWDHCHRGSMAIVMRSHNKSDCVQGPPTKIPTLSAPAAVSPAEDTTRSENNSWVDLTSILSSMPSDELDTNEVSPEALELAYPNELSSTEIPSPTSLYIPAISRITQPVSQLETTPVDPEVELHKDARSIEPSGTPHLVDLLPHPPPIEIPSNQRLLGKIDRPLSSPLWNSLPLLLPKKATRGLMPPVATGCQLRFCATQGCAALVPPYLTSSRCVKCVMAEWKARRAQISESSKKKGKGKSVTWADQQLDAAAPSNGWMSKIKRVRLKLSEPQGTAPAAADSPTTEGNDPQAKHGGLKRSISNKQIISDQKALGTSGKQTLTLCQPLDNSVFDGSDLSELTDTSLEDFDPKSVGSTSKTCTDRGSEPSPKPIRLTIRIPARTRTGVLKPSIPYAQCATRHCERYLPPNHRRDVCTWCHVGRAWRGGRGTLREETRTQVSTDSQSSFGDKTAVSPLLSVKDLINLELLSRGVVPGARICIRPSCHQILPGPNEYPTNVCFPCRAEFSRPRGTDQNIVATSDTSYAEIFTDVLDKNNCDPTPPRGRCRNRDCGVIVDSSPECWQCTNRRLEHRTQRGKTRGSESTPDSEKAPVVPMRSSGEVPSCFKKESSRPPSIITPYPEYRSQQDLLADFYLRITGCLEVLSVHGLYNVRRPQSKVVFGFDGQFSVVALDFDLIGRRGHIEKGVLKLKWEMGRLGTLYFDPTRCVTINGSGIFTRFVCVYRIHNTLVPPLAQEDGLMQGELEIAVLPDRSHRFIPGQRTVVRFRMIG